MKKQYPYLNSDRLHYRYKCVCCGAYIKHGTRQCYRCDSWFSENDVTQMREHYRNNSKQNWHHIIYFVVFVAIAVGIFVSMRY